MSNMPAFLTKSSQKRPETAFLNRMIHLPPLQLAESYNTNNQIKIKDYTFILQFKLAVTVQVSFVPPKEDEFLV